VSKLKISRMGPIRQQSSSDTAENMIYRPLVLKIICNSSIFRSDVHNLYFLWS